MQELGTEELPNMKESGQEENAPERILSCCYLYSLNNKSVKCAKDIRGNPVKTHTLKGFKSFWK